jgi:hypothetical protein
MLICDNCKQKNKGRYSTFEIQTEGGYKFVTFCNDCRYGKRPVKSQNEIFDSLQVPFWKLMGQKAKPKDIKLEKMLKWKGMTYGDWRRYRDYKENAKNSSAYNDFTEHVNKYGSSGPSDHEVGKER